MNKNFILTSNVLDIIFDGRNKDYGAYILRRDYNSHMRIALLIMALISIVFWVAALSKNNTTLLSTTSRTFVINGNMLSAYKKDKPEVSKLVKAIQKNRLADPLAPPKIVSSININKLPATTQLIRQSIIGTSNETVDAPGEITDEIVPGKGLKETSIAMVIAKKEHPAVLESADVMPEYPGGIKALLMFLKKNIHEPEDADESEDVAVKVKFIVNYNGNLEGFAVIQSGGDKYDNEVIRVLKKMPQWIPGKSKGESVSVYYVVPVRFTKQD